MRLLRSAQHWDNLRGPRREPSRASSGSSHCWAAPPELRSRSQFRAAVRQQRCDELQRKQAYSVEAYPKERWIVITPAANRAKNLTIAMLHKHAEHSGGVLALRVEQDGAPAWK
jgi:hypothetical protein